MSKPATPGIKVQVTNKLKFGLLFISLSSLLLEFTLIRILSVSLWYHFAFMIISIAMLGIGISGVTLALSDRINKSSTNNLLLVLSFSYTVSIIVSFYLINQIPFDPFSLLTDKNQFIYLPIYYLLITLPFFLSGLLIGIIFSRFKAEIARLYFFDLTGAGLSCFVFIWILPLYGGSGGIAAASIVAAIASLVFSLESKKFKTLAFMGFVVIISIDVLFLTNPEKYLPISFSKNKIYGNFIRENPDLRVLTEWNSFSRVDVMIDEDPPVDAYPVYTAIIDAGNSTTNIPRVPVEMDSFPPPLDASNLAMVLKKDSANVYIIGSGGGGEIVSALSHNANSVTAVEINGILNDLITKKLVNYWTGGIVRNKKVRIITDDARGFLRGKRIRYDVIISAHTISASATASGAMSLVENYILTEDAVKDYLNHLKPDGILYVSRPETQIARIVATLIIGYRELYKLDCKRCFFIFKRPPSDFEMDKSFLAGVVFKKDGFDEFDLRVLKTQAGILGLTVEYDGVSRQEGIYKELIESDSIYETIKGYALNLKPATDDNPYFEHQVNFTDLTFGSFKEAFSQTDRAVLSLTQKPAAEATIVMVLLQVVLIACVLIFLPLKLRFRKVESVKSIKKGKYILYFGCLGLGYIMVEICLIQRFTLFLGQPVYTMLTVISSMLIFSGIGSMYSNKVIRLFKDISYIYVVIAVLTVLIGFLNGMVFDLFVRADIYWRVLVSVCMIGSLGLLMGIPFPYGISKIEGDSRYLTAYAWGVNGFFSVMGAVLVVMLSMSYGFRVVFIVCAFMYLTSMVVVRRFGVPAGKSP